MFKFAYHSTVQTVNKILLPCIRDYYFKRKNLEKIDLLYMGKYGIAQITLVLTRRGFLNPGVS